MSQKLSCLFVAALWILTGCSKSASGPNTDSSSAGTSTASTSTTLTGSPKPCSLITQAEVESVLGRGASMTADTNPRTGMNECKLKLANGTDLDQLVMVIQPTNAQSWDMVKKTFMQDKKVKEVSGLGDDAINVGGYAGIWARKGDKYVQIFGSLKPERDEKAELYLLERAVSRL